MEKPHSSQEDPGACYGCKARLINYGTVRVTQEHYVNVCAGRAMGNGLFAPKGSCLAKALVKAHKLCPVCGEPNTTDRYYGPRNVICHSCRNVIEIGKNVYKDGKRKWYSIGESRFYALAWSGGRLGSEECGYDTLREALLRVISLHTEPAHDKAGEPLEECDKGARWDVLMAPGQAKRVREFLSVLQRALRTAEERGRSAGSSLLQGLASGEVTLDEYNEKRERPCR